ASAPRTLISTPAGICEPKRAVTHRVENSNPAGVRAARSRFKAAKSHAAGMLSPKLSSPRWLILRPLACSPNRLPGDSARVAREAEKPSSDNGRYSTQDLAGTVGKISRTDNLREISVATSGLANCARGVARVRTWVEN